MTSLYTPYSKTLPAIVFTDRMAHTQTKNITKFKNSFWSYFGHILPHLTKVIFSYLQVYNGLWKEKPVVIKCGVEDPVKTDGAPDSMLRQEMSLFDKPTRGTSMDEFKEMLHSFLKVSRPIDYFIITVNNCHHRSHMLIENYTCLLGNIQMSSDLEIFFMLRVYTGHDLIVKVFFYICIYNTFITCIHLLPAG